MPEPSGPTKMRLKRKGAEKTGGEFEVEELTTEEMEEVAGGACSGCAACGGLCSGCAADNPSA